MKFTIGDQVQLSINTDDGLTLVTGVVSLVGVWKPDIYKFEIAGLSGTFYTDQPNMTIKVVG